MNSSRHHSRKFSLSMLLYQFKDPTIQTLIKDKDNSRFFDAMPNTHCIFADVDDDLKELFPHLALVPEDSIELAEKGYIFTRQNDIALITKWAEKVLSHAANVMLTKENEINARIRMATGKTKDKLSAHDILLSYLATITMHLQVKMYHDTLPVETALQADSDHRLPPHPFEKNFFAFTTLINSYSSIWITELFEKRCPTRSMGYGEMAVGFALGAGALLLFGATAIVAVAAQSTNNDNSPSKPPSQPGHKY